MLDPEKGSKEEVLPTKEDHSDPNKHLSVATTAHGNGVVVLDTAAIDNEKPAQDDKPEKATA